MTGPEAEELILLKRKVEELVNKHRLTLDELEKVMSDNLRLGRRLEENEEELTGIKRELERVKISGAVLGDSDNKSDARKRINDLVREIDNCIALLNNI